MTDRHDQTAALAVRLAGERRSIMVRLARLQADFDGIVAAADGANVDDEHDPEGATIAFERAQVGALAGQARARLVEIEAALDRLRGAAYGTCEWCGEPIPAERLAVRPAARRCVPCAVR